MVPSAFELVPPAFGASKFNPSELSFEADSGNTICQAESVSLMVALSLELGWMGEMVSELGVANESGGRIDEGCEPD